METVLITGSASGIGRAAADAFLAAGWDVHATDVDEDGLAALADDGCTTHRLDVTDRSAVDAVVDGVVDESGGIDCLVNNAGYGQMGPVEDVPLDRIRAQFDVNLYGPIRCCKAVLPVMRRRGGGTIVNVASVQGRVATPGWGAYAASKHALEGLSDALRVEVDDQGVDVVLLEPAWVSTGFADGVAASLDGFDRTDCYDDVYRSLDGTSLVDGGRLAVSPERVGEKIQKIAEEDSPRARYTVGLGGRLVLLAGLLPDSVYDLTQKRALRTHSED